MVATLHFVEQTRRGLTFGSVVIRMHAQIFTKSSQNAHVAMEKSLNLPKYYTNIAC